MRPRPSLGVVTALLLLLPASLSFAANPIAAGTKYLDETTLAGPKPFNTIEPADKDGNLMVVIEIPAGTTGKWEVAPDGTIKWEIKKGKPRVVDFQGGYPCNYGSVPKTSLPKELGGDGDPVDVLIPGPSLPMGSVVHAKLVGVLRLSEEGTMDSKLVAVASGTPEFAAGSISALDAVIPGTSKKLEGWFTGYKGPGVITSQGYGDAEEARKMFVTSLKAFAAKGK